VYTPPKSFNKYHFLLGVISVAAIVLALTLGMSIFFKVENIYVAGTDKYSAWDIREASGIQVGDNLLTLGKAKVSGKIIARLPYVEKVRIGIKLPDTVNIEIVESDISYAIQAEDNGWWFINSQGRVLEMTTGIIAEYFTRIEGVKIMIPAIGQQAIAATAEVDVPFEPDDDTTESTETTDVTQPPTAPMDTVNAAEQLATVIKLIQHLESNGVVGEVTKINVTDLFNIELIYEDRYRVQLGDTSQMDRKVRSMTEAIAQMSDYQRGELDVSFTIWPDRAGYTPLQNDEEL
jgi:cell division septal protein FtsQ